MFGSSKKSETFKYEVEVNSLIREATAALNQRVLALEITNQQLIQHNQKLEFELQTLKQTLYTDVQRLEKRITDFTDLWHPIMSENMNRIKAELEETIRQAERKDIKKVSFDLENKLTKLLDERDNEKLLRKLVGFPEYMGSSVRLSKLVEKVNEYYSSGAAAASGNSFNFKFNVPYSNGITILNDNDNIIIEGSVKGMNSGNWSCVEYVVSDGFNTMYNYFKEHCKPGQQDLDNWLSCLFDNCYTWIGTERNGIPLPLLDRGSTTTRYFRIDRVLNPNNRKKIINWIKNGKNEHANIVAMLE